MLMESKANPRLPTYDTKARCQRCGAVAEHRVEVAHPDRGLMLMCGVCSLVFFGTNAR